ncbi:MAG: hypothetical protein JXB19_04600 [Bacteroidales bacterium]|nr:hypothetical protein [Bacteroidales bacterium]
MAVVVREVSSRKDLQRFIYLPEKIHAQHKNWIPPIYKDEWDFYNPGKNRSFEHCSTVLYLAYRDGKLLGRIMGIINHAYNTLHKELNARMFALECYHDHEVALALTNAAEEWAKKQGMNRIVGPFGFSDKDPQGFMIEGFNEPMVIATNYSLPYMVELMDHCGFKKEIDLLEYKVVIQKRIADFYEAVYNRTYKNNQFKLLEFNNRKALKPFIKPVFELINKTYNDIYGFLELDSGEINYFAKRYLPIINPEFVKIILDGNEQVAAFILAIPDISAGIRNAHGRLYPFGVFKILREAKRTKILTMLLGAIRPDYRDRGLGAILGMKIYQSASRHKYEMVDSHLVLETNTKMLAEYERLQGLVYKRYRIYYKNL